VKCSVFIATSLDGYIARRDHSLDWLTAYDNGGVGYGYAEFMATVDTLVIGRGTYDVVLGFGSWPYEGKRVVVLTNRPAEAKQGAELCAATPAELAERLAREGTKHAYIDGGNVIRQFLVAGLVDAFTLNMIPVVLGDGIPLFAPMGALDLHFELLGAQAYKTGVTQLRYAKSRR
jgi:dihydrofolate reductase